MCAKVSIGAAMVCVISVCTLFASSDAGMETGWKETTQSGAVVLHARGRPSITLVYPHKDAYRSQVLGVTWDGRIWYARTDESEGPEVHCQASIEIISPTGTARRIACLPADVLCIGGSLSPDARYVAYAVQQQVNDSKSKPPISVFVMASDGTRNRKVAATSYRGEAPAWVYRVSWSPDSTRVAIPVQVNGRNRIALVSVASGKTEYLPVPEWADVTCPDWSPDGKTIAYSCEDRRWKPKRGEGTDWTSFRWFGWLDSGDTEAGEAAEAREEQKRLRPASIWATDLHPGEYRPVTKTTKADVVDLLPRWSPGGTQIAYARWEWGHGIDDMHYWWLDLRLAQAQGGGDRAITAPIYPPDWGWGRSQVSAAEGDMEWLPDGRRIIYRECQEGAEGRATGLMMIRVDGKQAEGLTPGITGWPRIASEDRDGSKHTEDLLVEDFGLSPDGHYVLATGHLSRPEPSGIWRVPIPPVAASDR